MVRVFVRGVGRRRLGGRIVFEGGVFEWGAEVLWVAVGVGARGVR